MAEETNHLVFIGKQWPDPKVSAAGIRVMQLLEAFIEFGYKVFFCAANQRDEKVLIQLERLGVETAHFPPNDNAFDLWLAQVKPDVVVFERFITEEYFGWRVRKTLPSATTILDTEDLHSLRLYRQHCFEQAIDFDIESWLGAETTLRELASLYRCDLNLIISEYELGLLTSTMPSLQDKLLYLPLILEPVVASTKSFEERRHFTFAGNGEHPGNRATFSRLKERIWPEIRKMLPDAELHFYGANLNNLKRQFQDPACGVIVKGWATDLAGEMENYRLQLAPIPFGAGLKGKIFSASQAGVPTLGTTICWEGILPPEHASGLRCETEQSFILQAIELYSNGQLWKQAHKETQRILKKFTLSESFFSLLNEKIKRLKKSEILDEGAVIGSILNQELHGRTEYLSKYIELKQELRSTKQKD